MSLIGFNHLWFLCLGRAAGYIFINLMNYLVEVVAGVAVVAVFVVAVVVADVGVVVAAVVICCGCSWLCLPSN
jgi:hypothetical protein